MTNKRKQHKYAAEAYRNDQRTMFGDTDCEIYSKKFLGMF